LLPPLSPSILLRSGTTTLRPAPGAPAGTVPRVFLQGRLAMRSVWTVALGLAAVLVLVVGARADDKKEVTLEGKITCSKCDLKLDTDKCHTVIKTKDGKVYYFDDESGKKNHKKICQSPMDGKVTGTISEEGDKKIIKVSKVEFE
jgi:hypothetical protein